VSEPYSPDFEEARRAYGSRPNDRKRDAFKAWRQVELVRPAQDLLLACIHLYRDQLRADAIADRRLGDKERFKSHMSTWLRGEGWEGFMDAARERAARTAAKPLAPPAGDPTGFWSRLGKELGPEKVAAWFGGAVYDAESPSIAVAGAFKADWVCREFRFALHRAAGGRDVTVTVLPKDRMPPEVPWHQRS
jgi:hypothetical protein